MGRHTHPEHVRGHLADVPRGAVGRHRPLRQGQHVEHLAQLTMLLAGLRDDDQALALATDWIAGQVVAGARTLTAVLRDYTALTKPRIIVLLLVTTATTNLYNQLRGMIVDANGKNAANMLFQTGGPEWVLPALANVYPGN